MKPTLEIPDAVLEDTVRHTGAGTKRDAIPAADIVIAACARAHKVELEHCDRHFDRILPIAAKL